MNMLCAALVLVSLASLTVPGTGRLSERMNVKLHDMVVI